MRWLLLGIVLLGACTVLSPASSPSAQPTVQPAPASPAAPRPPTQLVVLGNGLVLDVPLGWTVAGPTYVNMGTERLVIAGNGDLAGLPTLPGNGDVDASALPSGRVAIAIQAFCRLSCFGPEAETGLPLDWNAASPVVPGGPRDGRTLPSDRHELGLGFRWFDQPLFFIARWADDAPAADIGAIAAIARSIRADPLPPARGEYRGWDAVGAPGDFPVGSIRLEALPAGAVVRPAFRTTDNVPFFLVRGKQNLYAFVSRPLVDQRCEIRFVDARDRFTCAVDGRTYDWTRFGRFLGPEPQSDLAQHRVIVREGLVWVHYLEASLLTPSVPDEAAER